MAPAQLELFKFTLCPSPPSPSPPPPPPLALLRGSPSTNAPTDVFAPVATMLHYGDPDWYERWVGPHRADYRKEDIKQVRPPLSFSPRHRALPSPADSLPFARRSSLHATRPSSRPSSLASGTSASPARPRRTRPLTSPPRPTPATTGRASERSALSRRSCARRRSEGRRRVRWASSTSFCCTLRPCIATAPLCYLLSGTRERCTCEERHAGCREIEINPSK